MIANKNPQGSSEITHQASSKNVISEFEREKMFLNAGFLESLTFRFLSYSSFCYSYKQVAGYLKVKEELM